MGGGKGKGRKVINIARSFRVPTEEEPDRPSLSRRELRENRREENAEVNAPVRGGDEKYYDDRRSSKASGKRFNLGEKFRGGKGTSDIPWNFIRPVDMTIIEKRSKKRSLARS